MIQIYILYIRSLTEQSAVDWHSSISKGEQKDIERAQKVDLRIILRQNYSSYADALRFTGLQVEFSLRKQVKWIPEAQKNY